MAFPLPLYIFRKMKFFSSIVLLFAAAATLTEGCPTVKASIKKVVTVGKSVLYTVKVYAGDTTTNNAHVTVREE